MCYTVAEMTVINVNVDMNLSLYIIWNLTYKNVALRIKLISFNLWTFSKLRLKAALVNLIPCWFKSVMLKPVWYVSKDKQHFIMLLLKCNDANYTISFGRLQTSLARVYLYYYMMIHFYYSPSFLLYHKCIASYIIKPYLCH